MLCKRLPILIVYVLGMMCSFAATGQIIYTIAGDGYLGNVGNNIPAVCAGTPNPSGICLDGKGNLYLTCTNSIRKVNLVTGIITTVAGSDNPGHTGDGGPALSATMEYPFDLCIDNNENLYITEWSSHYIRKINIRTGIISTIAGNGAAGFSGDNGPAAGAQLNRPQGIVTDAVGNIYFTDTYNSRIRKITMATGIITTVAGNGISAYNGDGGLAAGAGTPFPNDIAIDAAGNLYFTESLSGVSCRVRKIDRQTGLISTIAGNNNYAYSGDGGPAAAASIFGPIALCTDRNGHVYVSEYDDSRLRKIDALTGIITTIAGNGINTFTGDGGAAINASLYYPRGICTDTDGAIYEADQASGRIRKIAPAFTVFPSLQAAITVTANDAVICPGATVQFVASLSNGGADPHYFWQVNGVTASTSGAAFSSSSLQDGDRVQCILESSVCNNFFRLGSNTITISNKIHSPPQLSITASAASICKGQRVDFTAIAANAGPRCVYRWTVNGQPAGSDSAVFSSTGINNSDAIGCTVITDPVYSCGSSLSAVSNILLMQVSSAQAVAISIAASANDICPGSTVLFSATVANAGAAPVYQWSINGQPAGNNSSQFSYRFFTNNDRVLCSISGQSACLAVPVSSAPITMRVKANPVLAIAPADTVLAAGSQLQLTANANTAIQSWQWQPASQLVDPGTQNARTVPVQSDLTLELTATAVNGCTATAKSIVKLFKKLQLPAAFSPNGDGLNDIFRIPPNTLLNLKNFSIYDRWGQLVFSTTDAGRGWNGSMRGVQQPVGVYVYVLSGADSTGPIALKGSFVLIR